MAEQAQTLAERSAIRRRTWHRRRLATTTSPRDQLWAAAGWLASEARQLPPDRFADVVAQVVALAEALNEEASA